LFPKRFDFFPVASGTCVACSLAFEPTGSTKGMLFASKSNIPAPKTETTADPFFL
jgi:hypothetical protein